MFGLVVGSTCEAVVLAWPVEPTLWSSDVWVRWRREFVFPVWRTTGSHSRWSTRGDQSKRIDCDRVQLCAQALCLEEVLQVPVPAGALFYGQVRRREEVVFDADLRNITERAARRFHDIMARGQTPIVYREPKCRRCSLLEICLPPRKRARRSVGRYLEDAVTKVPV